MSTHSWELVCLNDHLKDSGRNTGQEAMARALKSRLSPVKGRLTGSSQAFAHKSVQADISLCCLNSQGAVSVCGYSDLKFSTVFFACEWYRDILPSVGKIFYHIGNNLPDSFQGIFRALIEPAQAWKFSTQTDILAVLFRPSYPRRHQA